MGAQPETLPYRREGSLQNLLHVQRGLKLAIRRDSQ